MSKRTLILWETLVDTDDQGRARLTALDPVDDCPIDVACRILKRSPRSVHKLAADGLLQWAGEGKATRYDMASVLALKVHLVNQERRRTASPRPQLTPPPKQLGPLFRG